MSVSGPKNKVTSRCSGQRHDVTERIDFSHRDIPERYYFNVLTLEPNFVTFPIGIISTSLRWNPTSRHSREVSYVEFNVAMFPRPSTKKFCKNFQSVENSLH